MLVWWVGEGGAAWQDKQKEKEIEKALNKQLTFKTT
jgi:hypothetical protein